MFKCFCCRLELCETQLDIVWYLVEVGENNDKGHWFRFSPFGISRSLAKVGSNKEHAMNDSSTAFCLAAEEGHVGIAWYLAGSLSNDGATPIFYSARQGDLDTVRHLAEVCANKDFAMNELYPLCSSARPFISGQS